MPRKILWTLYEYRRFSYEELNGKIIIHYGRRPYILSLKDYNKILRNYRGRTIKAGFSRTVLQRGSLGYWLKRNVTRTAIASYLIPILLHKGDAEIRIKFK